MGQYSIVFRHQVDLHGSRRYQAALSQGADPSTELLKRTGLKVNVKLNKGDEKERRFNVPYEMRAYLGEGKRLIAIDYRGKTVYRIYNPKLGTCKVPNWFGEVGEEVEILVRGITLSDLLQDINERWGLPLKLRMRRDEKVSMILEGKEVVADIVKIGWGGDERPYVEITIPDYLGLKHILWVKYDYETEPCLGMVIRGKKIRSRKVLSIRYEKRVDVVAIVYDIGGGRKSTHVIYLSEVPGIRIFNSGLFETEGEKVGTGWLPYELLKGTDWGSTEEKGMLGHRIAKAILENEGFSGVKIDNSVKNHWNRNDETVYYIFDASGTKNEEFMGFEIKLTTESEKGMLSNLNNEDNKNELLEGIRTWNNVAKKYGLPITKRGAVISIYVDVGSGYFRFKARWLNAS